MQALVLLAVLLSPPQAYELVEALFSENALIRVAAREKLIRSGDVTMAAALVEVVFFSKHGRADAVAVLERLLGEAHGPNFKAWIETIGRREDITPKKGYIAFKSRLFARIDPAFSSFLQESHPRTIRAEEIIFGGVAKDGIPALKNPKTVPASEAGYLTDSEMVFGVSVNGVTRAYPQRILDWHEMANDVVGGKAISLAYCTLCGSGILYDTTLAQGQTLTFGSSGLLYRSNKLMYDHQTNSLWSHLQGEPVMGASVGKGKKLRMLPLTFTTWAEWRGQNPGTTVLSLDTGHLRDYRPGAAYGQYFKSPNTMFPVWKKAPNVLETKDWIFSVELDGVRKAYPLATLMRTPLLHDVVGGVLIVLVSEQSAEAVRAYRAGARRFRIGQHGTVIDERSGEVFDRREEFLEGRTTRERLPRLAGHRSYWFGWYAFFPGAELYSERVE